MNDTQHQDASQQSIEAAPNPPNDGPVDGAGDSAPEGTQKALEEAHSRLEAAQQRINSMLLREIEHQAAKRLEVPSDLFDLGKNKLADLLTDNGDIDAEKVTAAVDALLKTRPSLAARSVTWGDVGAGYRGDVEDTPDWSTALRGPHL